MRPLGIPLVTALVLAVAIPTAAEPVSVVWQTPSSGHHVRCIGTIEDVDGDTFPDVLVEIDYTNDPSGHFKCRSGADGGVIWEVSPPGGVSNGCGYGDFCVNSAPDLDGDGLQEALLGTSWGGRTAYAIGDEPTIHWAFDTYTHDPPSGWVYSIDWIPDVNENGFPDIIFGCGSDNNRAYCVDGVTGTLIWKFQAPDAVYSVAPIEDVNGNGKADVLVGTGDDSDYAYCVDGGSVGVAGHIWSYDAESSVFSICSIDDVNDDDIDDALLGRWYSSGYPSNTPAGVVCVSGANGSWIWQYDMPNQYDNVMRVVTTDDLDDDGTPEVLIGSWGNTIVCVSGKTGVEHWSVPTGTTNGGDVWTIDAMKDVDYDGYDDVIAGSFDLKAYCVSGRDGEVLWTYTVGNRVYSVRGINDVNGDGIAEALVGTQYSSGGGKVFCLDADGDGTSVPPVENVTCRVDGNAVVVAWDLNETPDVTGYHVYRMAVGGEDATPGGRVGDHGSATIPEILAARAGIGTRGGFVRLNGELLSVSEFVDTSVVDGAMYAYMVGAVASDGEETFAGPVEILADLRKSALWLAPPRPNPFAVSSRMEFVAPAGADATFAVYDATGRLVRRLASGASGGEGTVTWDGLSESGDPVASGVYLVRMEVGSESTSRKVVVLR
jgi:outer membrane protein assembly factor BamB